MNIALEIHRCWIEACVNVLNDLHCHEFADKLKSSFKELEQEVERKTIEHEPSGGLTR
jgi:hypothetical protein